MSGMPETLLLTMQVIDQIHKTKPKPGDTGEAKCPKCGGKFKWSYGGPRAMRGSCETPKCLAFIS